MTRRMLLRLWTEAVLGTISACALVLTVLIPDWIERVFGFAPDGGDGSTEWGLVIFLALAALGLFFDVRRMRLRLV